MGISDDKNSNEFRVGLITLLSLLILIIGIGLGKGMVFSGSKPTVKIQFDNANGIEPSSPVWINGVRRGTVQSVELQGGQSVMVTAIVDDPSILRKDATAQITMLEITGGKKIDLVPGTASTELPNNAVIIGNSSADVTQLISIAGELGVDAKRVMKRLDSLTIKVNDILADGTIVRDIRTTASQASTAATSINQLIQDNRLSLQQLVTNLHDVSTDIQRIVGNTEPKVQQLLTKVENATASAQRLLDNGDSTVRTVRVLVQDVNTLVYDVKNGKGLVSKLLYDSTLSTRLDTALTNLGLFVNKIDQHGINVNVRLGTRP